MLSAPGAWTGRTSCMNCVRKPRLNRAVASVAVLTSRSLARVSGPRAMASASSVDRRLGHRRAEVGAQEVEVAALVRLLDVPREHPAVAALVARRRRGPGGAAAPQLRLGHLHADGAGVHV